MADQAVSVRFGATTDEFDSAASQIQDTLGEIGEKIAGAFVAEKIIDFTRAALEGADSLYILSERTGLAVETFSALNIPLKSSGSSVEDLAGSMRFLQRNIEQASEGNAAAIKKFDELGLSVTKLKQLSPDDQFLAIAAALGQTSDQAELTANTIGMLGRSAQGLIPILKETHGELSTLIKTQTDGGIITAEEAKKVHEFEDAWTSFHEHLKVYVVDYLTFMEKMGEATRQWAKDADLPVYNQGGATHQRPNSLSNDDIAKMFGGGGDTSGKGDNADIENAQRTADQQVAIDEAKIKTQQALAKDNIAQQLVLQDQLLKELDEYYTKDSTQYQKALQEKIRMQQEADKAADASSRKFFTSVEQGVDQMVNGVLQGTQTWQQAMGKLFDNLALKFIDDFVVKAVLEWAGGQAKMLAATIATNLGITASNTEAAATSTAVGGAASVAKVTGDSAVTFAGVFANLSALLGPAAAGPAAAAQAAVLAQAPLAASYDIGTNYVPQTGLAMVHQGEQIIPANAQGPGYSGGANITFNIQAIDTQSGMQFLHNNAGTIAMVISNQSRNQNSAIPGWKM